MLSILREHTKYVLKHEVQHKTQMPQPLKFKYMTGGIYACLGE